MVNLQCTFVRTETSITTRPFVQLIPVRLHERFDKVRLRFDKVILRFDKVRLRFDKVRLRFDKVRLGKVLVLPRVKTKIAKRYFY